MVIELDAIDLESGMIGNILDLLLFIFSSEGIFVSAPTHAPINRLCNDGFE